MGYGIGQTGRESASTPQDDQKAQRLSKPRRGPDYPQGRKLDCGCVVHYRSQVMSANLGSSCCECYDRMAD